MAPPPLAGCLWSGSSWLVSVGAVFDCTIILKCWARSFCASLAYATILFIHSHTQVPLIPSPSPARTLFLLPLSPCPTHTRAQIEHSTNNTVTQFRSVGPSRKQTKIVVDVDVFEQRSFDKDWKPAYPLSPHQRMRNVAANANR